MDPQFIVFRKLIFYRHIKFSRETILAIRTYTVNMTLFLSSEISATFQSFFSNPSGPL